MDRNEQVGLVLARDAHTLVEAQELVLLAGQVDIVLAGLGELFLELQRKGQRDRLFDRAVGAFGAAVDAAVAGVDHHREALVADRSAGLPSRSPFFVDAVEPVVCAWSASAWSNLRSDEAAIVGDQPKALRPSFSGDVDRVDGERSLGRQNQP